MPGSRIARSHRWTDQDRQRPLRAAGFDSPATAIASAREILFWLGIALVYAVNLGIPWLMATLGAYRLLPAQDGKREEKILSGVEESWMT